MSSAALTLLAIGWLVVRVPGIQRIAVGVVGGVRVAFGVTISSMAIGVIGVSEVIGVSGVSGVVGGRVKVAVTLRA